MPWGVVSGSPTVCQCYTQQATRVPTDFEFCLNVVQNGYFNPSIPDRLPLPPPPPVDPALAATSYGPADPAAIRAFGIRAE